MNYTTLVSSVIATTENEADSFISQLPDMVGRAQERILGDIDDIGLTMQHVDDIKAYEQRRRAEAPWLF